MVADNAGSVTSDPSGCLTIKYLLINVMVHEGNNKHPMQWMDSGLIGGPMGRWMVDRWMGRLMIDGQMDSVWVMNGWINEKWMHGQLDG